MRYLLERSVRACAVAAAALSAASASATWSILLVDLSTGEIAIGSATCLTGFDLQANTPVLIPGVGATTAQSFVDSNGINRSLIRDRLLEGVAPQQILDELSVFDAGHQTRQYGMIDVAGNAATFTGTGAGAWAGGTTGVIEGAGITGGYVLYAIQGNVLWGPGVVDDAVDAVRDAPGDLPAKLLAGMQAARDAGGDGRCSCLPNDADACIDDVPMGQKSSDIAYMLVARAGDREGCSPLHRLGAPPVDIESLGADSFVISFANSTELAIVTPGDEGSPPTLGEVRRIDVGVDLRSIAAGDLNGDNIADVVGIESTGESIWLLLSNPLDPSGYDPASSVGETGTDVAISGGEILVADATRSAIVRIASLDGEDFTETEQLPLLSPAVAIAAERVFFSGREDAVVLSEDGTVTMFEFAAGRVLQERYVVPTAVPGASIVAGVDVDRDGLTEILVSSRTSELVEVIDGRTGVQESLIPAPSRVRDIESFETSAGPAAFVLGISSSALLEPLFPGGPVIYEETLPIRQQPVAVLPQDLDGDGDQDLAVVGLTGSAVRFIDNVEGSFPLTQGCGDGDFYMEFNIAFSARQDPDPVDQLEGLFGAWASDLASVPDAVRSSVIPDQPYISSIPGCPTRLRVSLVDRLGLPAAATGIVVEAPPRDDAIVEVGDITNLGGGQFEVELLGAGLQGTQTFTIAAQTDRGEVRLMPEREYIVDDLADLDGDGDRDGDDLSAWIVAYQADDPRADQNLDGVVSIADFNAWILNRNRACN